MHLLSGFLLLAVALPLAYLYLLALASTHSRRIRPLPRAHHRFAIAIPAHDEEGVIGHSLAALRQLEYPPQLFDVHVVADHCHDRTVQIARATGAIVHERQAAGRSGKGAALNWLLPRVLDDPTGTPHDAVVIFDADTRVAPDFLGVMDARLARGELAIQGQHRIGNPQDGWFPALAWAMLMIDNRFQNLGRANLGWSAKNMGDSICVRADVLHRLGWSEGLTEDYAFRHRLLLQGVRISYEPSAIGYGEAPITWRAAGAQRARWLRGTHDVSRRTASQLLWQGLRQRDLALLDGALQACLPSYSSLTLLALAAFGVQLLLRVSPGWLGLWALVVAALALYPLLGLALERAPLRAYLVILSGPLFILWRTWLALRTRLGRAGLEWVRTPRHVP